MTCADCKAKDSRIAQLERDKDEAATSSTHFYKLWIELKEAKKGKQNG